MANYQAVCRSNYFLVKDLPAFKEELDELNLGIWEGRDDGRVGIYEDEGNGWPSYHYNEVTEVDEEFDITAFVAKHLVEGEVAILQEVGYEKLRYFIGYAIAVNAAGDSHVVDLGSIKNLARTLGPNVTDPTY